jgi:hypothetical protein
MGATPYQRLKAFQDKLAFGLPALDKGVGMAQVLRIDPAEMLS